MVGPLVNVESERVVMILTYCGAGSAGCGGIGS